MLELQCRSVQKISGKGKSDACGARAPDLPWSPIKRVSDNRVPQRCQVDSNLVSTSGINFYFEQSEFSIRRVDALLDGVVGDGFASARAQGSHASAANTVA